MRALKTRGRYLASFSTRPISTKYGFDRGRPVDRFYIESFLKQHAPDIKGVCLEIVDSTYTKKFGGEKVERSDVLDIIKRKTTTIHGDLRNARGLIADNTYDTIIITQTFNVIDDYQAAIKECHRILKPGGKLFVTLPTISPAWNLKINMWRFSVVGAKYVFGKYFDQSKITISDAGNQTSVECFWLGLSVEDMKITELEKYDPNYPLIITVVATK